MTTQFRHPARAHRTGSHRAWALTALVGTALLGFGCMGELMEGSEGGSLGGGNGSGSDSSDEGPVSVDDLDTVDPETLLDGVPAGTRMVRLGYAEYDRTVSDLLYLQGSWSELFPAEPPSLGAYEAVASRAVNERLYNELALAAVDLAQAAVASTESYGQVVGCTEVDAACRDSFIDTFGRRAYRRPLTDDERARLTTLFDSGAELVASGDAFRDGVQLVIEAVLQSAKFLYRAERGSGMVAEQGTKLTDYEIASRLSYLFWGTMPDEQLFEAAAAGALSTPQGLEEQARRLAESPRAALRVRDFHARWIQLGDLGTVEKNAEAFPKFSQDLIASLREETLRFVETVTLEENGAIVELLTAPYTFADERLADLYGLSGSFGTELQRVELPAESGRMGLLTQGAFLTGHSSNSTGTSPILRGVFLLERLACQHVPAPPPGAELQEPDGDRPEIRTTRDLFAWKTSMDACTSCHSIINPVGFGFEQFDGIGQFRTTENGVAVDASGSLLLGDDTIDFQNATDLISGLASLGRIRGCYAKNWLTYFYGRPETADDGRVLARLTQNMGDGGFGVRDLLVGLTQGAAFTHLPPIASE